MLCGWEGNRRSVIAPVGHVSQTQWSIRLRAQRPNAGDEQHAYASGHGPLYLPTIGRKQQKGGILSGKNGDRKCERRWGETGRGGK